MRKERKKRPIYKVEKRIIKENVKNSGYHENDLEALEIFATRLNDELEFQNIIQDDFWKKIDVKSGSLSRYRNGSRFPQANTLLKIAKELNCSTDFLLGLTGPNQKSTDEKVRIVHKLTGLSDNSIEELENYAFSNQESSPWMNEIIDVVNLLIENLKVCRLNNYTYKPIIMLIARYLKFDSTTAKPFSMKEDGSITQYETYSNEELDYLLSKDINKLSDEETKRFYEINEIIDKKETITDIDGNTLNSIFLGEIEKALAEIKEKSNVFNKEKNK